MKKFALILLVFVYSLATMGFSLQQFYCCGKLTSTSVLLIQSEKKKDYEKSGCCNNKYRFLKVKSTHITAENVNAPARYFSYCHFYIPLFSEFIFTPEKSLISYSSNAPPLTCGVKLYIHNCVFRI